MALPTYDKSKRRKSFEILPKGAYVVKIISAKQEKWPSGDAYIKVAFDIAEGEHKGFYTRQYEAQKANSEDAKWPFDAVYNLNIPGDGSQDYVYTNWNTFFADLEDSNNGFVFDGNLLNLKGKLIGGKFRNEQSEYNGNIYDHTRLAWTCVAEDVRTGNAGKMPNDKLVGDGKKNTASNVTGDEDFMKISDDAAEELPF